MRMIYDERFEELFNKEYQYSTADVMDCVEKALRKTETVDIESLPLVENLRLDNEELKKQLDKIKEEKTVNERDLETKIFDELIFLSVPCDVYGFDYISTAVKLLCEDFNKYRGITTVLYPEIARKYSTTPKRVERGIRTAISASLKERKSEETEKYFGGSTSISNGLFVVTIARRLNIGNKTMY